MKEREEMNYEEIEERVERLKKGGREKREKEKGGRRKAEEREEYDLERSGGRRPRRNKMLRGRNYEEDMDRVAGIRGIEERKGVAVRWVIITELEEIADREKIITREGEMKWK